MTAQNTTSQILREKKEERMRVFCELQEYSLKKSGYELTQQEYEVIHKFISEHLNLRRHDKYELFSFYYVLKKIINQAESLQFADGFQVRSYMKERFKKSL